MKRRIITYLLAFTMLLGAVVPLIAPVAGAVDVFDACSGDNAGTAVCSASNSDSSASSFVGKVVNIILWALGISAVVVIIIGGFMYVTSSGDPGKAKAARSTILYAVIGLVVAIGAYAIVRFVVGNI